MISSSSSGQWIPSPPAMRRQLVRSVAVPCARRENHASGAAIVLPIRQVHDQSIIADTYTLRECFPEFSARSTHAMPSTKSPRFPRPVFRFVRFSPGRSSLGRFPVAVDGAVSHCC